jgi:hypothetical protein
MDGRHPDEFEEDDWLDIDPLEDGPTDPADQPVSWRRPRARYVLAGIVLLALFTAGSIQHVRNRTDNSSRGGSTPANSASLHATSRPPDSSNTTRPATSAPPGSDGSVTVSYLGTPLLNVPSNWELLGYGPGVVVRIDLAGGRITSTTLPPFKSGASINLLIGDDRMIVRPVGSMPSFVVSDGQPARPLTGVFASSGGAFPGPDPKHIWVPGGGGKSMVLTDLNGHPTGTSLPVDPKLARSDGAGYLMFSDTGGVYDARPSGIQRITTGDLLAAGPRTLLIAECDARHRCTDVVIDRSTGARRAVAPRKDTDLLGVISPDGMTAAMVVQAEGTLPAVHLVDLATGRDTTETTGRDTTVKAALDGRQIQSGRLAWSPDSRWLFLTNAHGQLVAVDRAGDVRVLAAAALPPLSLLGFRSSP